MLLINRQSVKLQLRYKSEWSELGNFTTTRKSSVKTLSEYWYARA